MADVHSPEVRSFNMSRIRGKNTKPEILVRKFLFANGFRYRIHMKNMPGKPDIVLPKFKTVIFIHGCFWHGHEGCKYFVIPKTKTEWWVNKISGNRKLDSIHTIELEQAGWRVLTIFECQLKTDKINETLKNVIEKITI